MGVDLFLKKGQIIEHRLNENYHRIIGASPMSIKTGIFFFDPFRRKVEYKINIENPITDVKNNRLMFNLNDEVFIKNHFKNKLDKRYVGPFKITEIGDKKRWYKVDKYSE